MKNHKQQPWRDDPRFQEPKRSEWRWSMGLEEKLLSYMNESTARALGWIN